MKCVKQNIKKNKNKNNIIETLIKYMIREWNNIMRKQKARNVEMHI